MATRRILVMFWKEEFKIFTLWWTINVEKWLITLKWSGIDINSTGNMTKYKCYHEQHRATCLKEAFLFIYFLPLNLHPWIWELKYPMMCFWKPSSLIFKCLDYVAFTDLYSPWTPHGGLGASCTKKTQKQLHCVYT